MRTNVLFGKQSTLSISPNTFTIEEKKIKLEELFKEYPQIKNITICISTELVENQKLRTYILGLKSFNEQHFPLLYLEKQYFQQILEETLQKDAMKSFLVELNLSVEEVKDFVTRLLKILSPFSGDTQELMAYFNFLKANLP